MCSSFTAREQRADSQLVLEYRHRWPLLFFLLHVELFQCPSLVHAAPVHFSVHCLRSRWHDSPVCIRHLFRSSLFHHRASHAAILQDETMDRHVYREPMGRAMRSRPTLRPTKGTRTSCEFETMHCTYLFGSSTVVFHPGCEYICCFWRHSLRPWQT